MKDNLKSFFTEHWKYMAVNTACKLNLFDNLQKAKTATQLANECALNEDKLLLLLNALFHAGFLTKLNHQFALNELSELLTEDNPESLKYACMNWSGEHLTAWQQLDFSIKTGKSSFEAVYSLPFFDYLNENPEKLVAYHKAMYEYAREDYKTLPNLIDFSKHNAIMDVGGGYGAVIENVKNTYPNLDCILFDLPKVVEQTTIPNITKIGGSFFDMLPEKAEAMILSRVLHDWDDEKASLILKNCFGSLPHHGTLYIIENCTDKIDIDVSLLSLNMTAICESYERTLTEYVNLSQAMGFDFKKDIKLNALQTILIFTKP